MAKTFYIGLGVTYHDPALAIVDQDGRVLFAEATERYLQYKRALNCEPDNLYRLPEWLASYCSGAQRLVVASNWLARRPLYERLVSRLGVLSARGLSRTGIKRLRSPLANYQLHHMMAANRSAIGRAGLNLARMVKEVAPECRVEFRDYDHHAAHAASAVYASPFDACACAVVDSYGERGSLAFFTYQDGHLKRLPQVRGLASLGLLYMKLTELCGFDWLKGEEWKVMGLAPYGALDEEVLALLRSVLRVSGLELDYVDATLFDALRALETHRRLPGQPAEAVADLAFTGQYFFTEIMLQLLGNLAGSTGMDRLALAGGCALNSSCNGQIIQNTPFREVYVPPAPADDGTALGAAWLAWREDHGEIPPRRESLSPYLGSELSEEALLRLLRFGSGLDCRHLPETVCEETARLLAQGSLVAWVQGRAEFGPRALGNRSILADPRNPGMKDRINALVKFREEYRPFAPCILHQHGPAYFEHYQDSPYMERTLRFRDEAARRVPAVVHVDGTGRLQSVTSARNPRFFRLLEAFQRESGVPLLLNTSFNVMGKPIVHSVEDAVSVFMTSGLDVLVIGDHLIAKPGVL